MDKKTESQVVDVLNKLSARLIDGKLKPGDVSYIFDPQPDMTLAEVVALLRTLTIRAPSDQYMHEKFPPGLKRHFRPDTGETTS